VSRFQRRRVQGEEQRATTLELFYDLVFVFAITQVSHLLLDHLDWAGVAQSLVVLLVVWWSWNYTTWATNELDPDSPVVRVAIIAVMLASLVMAVAIPEAFGDRALLFAGGYVAIQVGRTAFLAFAAGAAGSVERERAGRILIWFAASGVLWLLGAVLGGSAQVVLWLAALALDYGAPLVTFWVPGLRKVDPSAWELETGHFAERFQLFVIIALGESIVLTGATTSDLNLDAARLAALGLAFLGSAALWWLYFNYAAAVAQRRLELAANRTLTARDAYTYLHVVIVLGVIVSAVGDELVIAHPTDVLPGEEVAAVVAGPAIYLFALSLFRLRMAGSLSPSRLIGALACVALGALGAFAPALVLMAALVGVLTTVIAYEHMLAVRRVARGEPSPLERLQSGLPVEESS
jgi:low temperature requirement protein LtrA